MLAHNDFHVGKFEIVGEQAALDMPHHLCWFAGLSIRCSTATLKQ
ncbi:hypothetical protein I552_0921 [Mycobacterium xenopi 3993]|nr:hypothetical protein I552_0921 [Mycobacterium xenopi 3993]